MPPEYVLLPLINLIAPPDDMPVPLIVIGSATVIPPNSSRDAPFEIVVPDPVPPRPELLETLNAPADTTVVPL